MVDFLKAFPFVSVEDYMWGLSAPMIELIAIDNTHVRYLSDKEAEMRSAKKITNETMRNDLGMPILVIDNDNNNDNNNKN